MLDYEESVPWYPNALDFDALHRDYPPPPDYFRTRHYIPRDELRALQEARFLATMNRAWEIPFFQRHWSKAGMERGDVRGLDDLAKIPPYTIHDIRDSIERAPPFGDFIGLSPADGKRMPLVFHTSGGTTGNPRPMFYAPQDRQVMGVLGGRRFAMAGVRPGDMVMITYAAGLWNGAIAIRDQMWAYTGAVPVVTASGAVTSTRRQVELAKLWGINVIAGMPAFLRHLAQTARDELGIDPKSLGIRVLCSHLGPDDRKGLEELWGARCFDAYGTSESGMLACECQYQSGMHIMEDALLIEIMDPETGRALPDGEKGTAYITTLYKYGAPQIRFNVNDISSIMPGACACGGTFRRIEKIFGRNDNMVKLRGSNVFPEAIGTVVGQDARSNGEYFCIVERVGDAGTDEMRVLVEVHDLAAHAAAIKADLETRLRDVLGVRVSVEPVARGALDPYTGTSQVTKIKRLADRRKPTTP
jgi:phenylacetate-CoA ligase